MTMRESLSKFVLRASLALLVASPMLAAAPLEGDAGEGTVTYQVVFVPSWNPETHPEDYPITHAKKGLLTPMIGATHGSEFRIFEAGALPTPGLERLSEMGKHDPLDSEIRAAVAAGKAGSLIELDEGSEGPVHAPVTSYFRIDPRHPMVSLVGMIAPSPDWFYGVSSVALYRDGRFVPALVVDVYAWDSGGDSGSTYMAEDQDLEPKAKTQALKHDAFVRDGQRLPVGTFVFKLVPSKTS